MTIVAAPSGISPRQAQVSHSRASKGATLHDFVQVLILHVLITLPLQQTVSLLGVWNAWLIGSSSQPQARRFESAPRSKACI